MNVTYLDMNGIRIQKDGNFIHTNSLSPFSLPSNGVNEKLVPPPPPTQQSLSSLAKISPALVLVIILLAAVFFAAGLAHLLLRFLAKRPSSSSPRTFQSDNGSAENSRSHHALQRQLRQLFWLHDSGLDQAVIDSLPVFRCRDIAGAKQPFDCPVCLCELAEDDELRLLPACSHAFHARCIDTWLLSNSTCPLCRRVVSVSDLFVENPVPSFEESVETPRRGLSGRVFSVRLGKFKSSNGLESGERSGETSGCSLDSRRCCSMGTFQYVVGESDLQVTLRREIGHGGELEGKKIMRRQKGESFSVSKIWLWSKNNRLPGCSGTDIHAPNPNSLSVSTQVNDHTQTAQMLQV